MIFMNKLKIIIPTLATGLVLGLAAIKSHRDAISIQMREERVAQEERYKEHEEYEEKEYAESQKPIAVIVDNEDRGIKSRLQREEINFHGTSQGIFYKYPLKFGTNVNKTVSESFYVIGGHRKDNGKPIAVNILGYHDKTKEGLDMLVSIGSEITFPSGNIIKGRELVGFSLDEMDMVGSIWSHDSNTTLVYETVCDDNSRNISKYAFRITVLDPDKAKETKK